VVVDVAPVDYDGRSEFSGYVDGLRSIDLDQLQSRQSADDQLADAVPSRTVRSFLLQNLRRNGDGQPAGWHWQMNLQLLGDQLDALSGFPQLDSPPYQGPTLWVAGADSNYIKPEYASVMRELFPQVRTIKIKNAAHWVHSEQPDVFLGVLNAFLDRTTDPRSSVSRPSPK
jgi:esterase